MVRRVSFGMTSLSRSSRLPDRSDVAKLIPVTLPPGLARLATSRVPTGSPANAITIGVVVVAAFAVWAAVVPKVTITSGLASSNSRIRAGRRSTRPWAALASITRLVPST